MLFSSLCTAAFASIGVALSRRTGVISVHTSKIQTPLLKKAADVFLDAGDGMVAFAERQGVDVNKYIGASGKK